MQTRHVDEACALISVPPLLQRAMSFPASELLAVNMAQQGHCHDSEVTAPGACATIVDPLQSLTRRHSQAIRGRGDLLHPCTRPVSYVPQPSGDRTQFVNPVREIRSMAPRGARVQRGGRDEGSRGGVTDVVRFSHKKSGTHTRRTPGGPGSSAQIPKTGASLAPAANRQ